MVAALKLEFLAPAKGSKKKKTRVGRGESSGHGKTCGRGGKGQTARNGKKIPGWFEGGQMPLYRRVPKLGFRSKQRLLGENAYLPINLSDLEQFDNGSLVDSNALMERGFTLSRRHKAGYKILGGGTLTKKITVVAHGASESAKQKIAAVGGEFRLAGKESSDSPAK